MLAVIAAAIVAAPTPHACRGEQPEIEMSSKRPPLPTFLILGAQKSATRWLRSNLGRHPDIFAAPAELHFWNVAHRVRSPSGLDWYRAKFERWDGEPVVGEATPGYMIWRHKPAWTATRIKQGLPDARLIAILRNPVDRANSAMVHHIRRQRLPAQSRLVDVVRERRPAENDRLCLVSGGWYAGSLQTYKREFGDQLLVLLHDDVLDDPARVYDAALRHVGAEPGFVPPDLSQPVFSNQRARSRGRYDLSADERREMWQYFRHDVARLSAMFDLDLSRWEPGFEPSKGEAAPPRPARWLDRVRSRSDEALDDPPASNALA